MSLFCFAKQNKKILWFLRKSFSLESEPNHYEKKGMVEMAKIWKKLLAITLALSMTMGMLSMTSLAVGGEEPGTEPETKQVTLTYMSTFSDNGELIGVVGTIPPRQTVNAGDTVVIADYSGMRATGYKPIGWSTEFGATEPDKALQPGSSYTLTEDTTLYSVWEKIPEGNVKPEPPDDSTEVRQLLIRADPRTLENGGLHSISGAFLKNHYTYSYEYRGVTYTGTTENQKLPNGGGTTDQILNVFVAADGSEPTQVKLTLTDYEIEGYALNHQRFKSGGSWIISSKEEKESISLSVTLDSPKSMYPPEFNFPDLTIYTVYEKAEEENPDRVVTERDVDIVVAFLTPDHASFTREQVSEDYTVTYSYQNAEGETVTGVLHRDDAEVMDSQSAIFGKVEDGMLGIVGYDPDKPYYHFKWTIPVSVVGKGIYLTITQNNYDIVTETPYVWDHVFGVQRFDGENVSQLYVSKDNNPVTSYIYNMYAKEFTVTYTDGVNGSAFADQAIKAKEGDSTPAFNGTPVRSGYTFIGWDKEIAETVTEDVTYTAQWQENTFTVTWLNGYNDQAIKSEAYGVVTEAEKYTTEYPANPARDGYTFTGWGDPVADDNGNITITAQWQENYVPPVATYYTLTINYVDGEGNAVADSYTARRVSGWNYNVPSPAVEGMTPDQATVSGTLNRSVTITVTYAENEIPETQVPETETPEVTETPEPEESEDLIETEPPLEETPEVTETPEPTETQDPDEGEDLDENDTPLADVPQTGDSLSLWILLTAASAAGLAWISAKEKKGRRIK